MRGGVRGVWRCVVECAGVWRCGEWGAPGTGPGTAVRWREATESGEVKGVEVEGVDGAEGAEGVEGAEGAEGARVE